MYPNIVTIGYMGNAAAENKLENIVMNTVDSSDLMKPHDLSDVAQLDGIDDPPGIDDPLTLPPALAFAQPRQSGMPATNHPAQPLQTNVRKASFTLKQKKQLSGLCKDTKISDFDITVSPVAHNVTIKCSTGFYNLVVIPAFSGICERYENYVDGVTIRCNSITGHIDGANSNITAVIVFPLAYQDGKSAGSVTMSLHHTTRRVQLQGSSLVHGTTRAPVWFVDHVIKGNFNFFARTKSVDISAFNTSVRDLITKTQTKLGSSQSCHACSSQFDGRSTPELCPDCKHTYQRSVYKAGCIPARVAIQGLIQ